MVAGQVEQVGQLLCVAAQREPGCWNQRGRGAVGELEGVCPGSLCSNWLPANVEQAQAGL